MPLNLNTILELVNEIAQDVLAPNAATIDREARWPETGIRTLQQAGLGGLVVPTANGGLGCGLLGLAQVCEILGRACPSTAICFGMHCVGSAVIAAKATSPQQTHYLTPINQGQHLTTLSLSEPGSGAHFYLPQTQLEAISPDMFKVTGVKTFVTNGGYADSYVVSTTAADLEAPMDQFSCIIVPRESAGLKWGAAWHGLGLRGNASRTLELKEAQVPRQNLLGQEGDQLWYIFHIVTPYFLAAMAGTYLGLASAALAEAKTHLSRRHFAHSGTKLAQLSLLQHRLGTLWGMVERTRRLIYFAAHEVDTGGPEALPAIFTAKAEVADCAVSVVNEALTLSGGIAYQNDSKLPRLLRDARAAHVMSPTTDMLRIWTGRALLDQPLLGE